MLPLFGNLIFKIKFFKYLILKKILELLSQKKLDKFFKQIIYDKNDSACLCHYLLKIWLINKLIYRLFYINNKIKTNYMKNLIHLNWLKKNKEKVF